MYHKEMWHRAEACPGLAVCTNLAGREVCSYWYYHNSVWMVNVAGRIGENRKQLALYISQARLNCVSFTGQLLVVGECL